MQVKHDTSRKYAYIAMYSAVPLKDGRVLLRRIQVDIFFINQVTEMYRRLRSADLGGHLQYHLVASNHPPTFLVREEINWRD